jgi:hypothetical protein
MSFYNGVPITVVSGLQHMLTPIESTSRRRAAEEARLETTCASETPH